MKISQKLLIIVCLTVAEVSITVWATYQISKGATLHQLNSLHLKHNAHFSELVGQAAAGRPVTQTQWREAVHAIRDQPIAALEAIGKVDHLVMNLIGTDIAIELIHKDISDADQALEAIEAYGVGRLDHSALVTVLRKASHEFNSNSSRFEGPVTHTVAFMLKTMIPMIIGISLFNICFITYLSRSISSSIRSLIGLLRSGEVPPGESTALSSHAQGELKELMQVAEDRLRSELMNVETNQELSQLIGERTQSLQIARNEAQASLEAKERFLANMSHEIRTPINGILCASDLMLHDLDTSDPHYEFNSIIQDSAGLLLRILNDILDVSKIESGQLSLEKLNFDLLEVVDQVVSLMRPVAETKGLEFQVQTEAVQERRFVVGDSVRIRQILVNLLSNAIKFTEQGSVAMQLEVAEAPDGQLQVVVAVRDTGIGMTPEQVERVFARFVQADESTTRRFGGTGLGMSLCRELARLMGGDVDVESTPEAGTSVRLHLTLPRGRKENAGSKGSNEARNYNAQILLVEDNRVNQRVISKVLERVGLKVRLADNGLAALEQATEDIDIVLMDIQMPVMDGVTATRELLARGWSKPIIAFSANVFEEEQRSYLAAGMAGFLAKPVQQDQLIALLDQHLGAEQRKAA